MGDHLICFPDVFLFREQKNIKAAERISSSHATVWILFGPEEQRAPEVRLKREDRISPSCITHTGFWTSPSYTQRCIPWNRTKSGGTSSFSLSSSGFWRAGTPLSPPRRWRRIARTPSAWAGTLWRPPGPWWAGWAGWPPEERQRQRTAAWVWEGTASQTGSQSRKSLLGGIPRQIVCLLKMQSSEKTQEGVC